jgi:broad specificity phosphatase PhoE
MRGCSHSNHMETTLAFFQPLPDSVVRLYLIRHGETFSNIKRELDTAPPGSRLTALGHSQARVLARAFDTEEIALICASRLLRAQQTATPLANRRGMRVDIVDGLEEISAGLLESRSDSKSLQSYAAVVASWMRGDLTPQIPGGPTGFDFHRRFNEAIVHVTAAHSVGGSVAVFSHGAAIRAFMACAVGLMDDSPGELRIPNAGVGVLQGTPPGGWALVHWPRESIGNSGVLPWLSDGAGVQTPTVRPVEPG